MPKEIPLTQAFTLFGVRVVLSGDDRNALCAVERIYAAWNRPDLFDGATTIYIVLRTYDVNEKRPRASSGNPYMRPLHAESTGLAMTDHGISIRADGRSKRGSCEYPAGSAESDAFAEMINTVILFLIAQSGRIPVHASAVMMDGMAIIFAGPSGSGKSMLALAADRSGLHVLSDDTVFVETVPALRIWALPAAIHVFGRDAPGATTEKMRYRSGRWKRVLPVSHPAHVADRAILCVLEKGEMAGLVPMAVDDAVAALTAEPEPGYGFYGARSAAAIRALAAQGCWRLTLSTDPAEAIACVTRTFAARMTRAPTPPFHTRYLALAAQIEHEFPVSRWRSGDVDIWPLARMDLYLDMYWHHAGTTPPSPRAFPLRAAARTLRPLTNLWKSRHDLAHHILHPHRAHAILLGDGVSLDRIAGIWQDRFGEPVIAALEKQGHNTFVMQSGDLSRLPWRRPAFAANRIEARGWLASLAVTTPPELPELGGVQAYLAASNVVAPSLARAALARRAAVVSSTASGFERVLRKVNPSLAFVVTYYAGLGHAFMLACRRQGILSVDLQHCPQGGTHKAYNWPVVPAGGYTTLPALFWNWTVDESENIRSWSARLDQPWHQSIHGGHTQITPFLNDADPQTMAWDKQFRSLGNGDYEREILVALQPIGGHRGRWNALASLIEAAPANWRWWIRRHPSSRAHQDAEFGRLLSLRKPNVMIAAASDFPLPALLRHMSAVLSLTSGASVEAAFFGVPSFFLSEEARGMFPALIAQGRATIIDMETACIAHVLDEIRRLPARPGRDNAASSPDIGRVLAHLEILAQDYARLCRAGINRPAAAAAPAFNVS